MDLATHPMQGIPDHVKARCYIDKRTQAAREWCRGYMAFEDGKPMTSQRGVNGVNGWLYAERMFNGPLSGEANKQSMVEAQETEIEILRRALILVAGECDLVHDELLTAGQIDDDWEKRLGGASQFAHEIARADTSEFTERRGITKYAKALHAKMSDMGNTKDGE